MKLSSGFTSSSGNLFPPPLVLKKWIEEHRHELKPPVANKVIWKNRSLIAMIVGGPNSRTDFHVNSTDEFFFQLEGSMHLKSINSRGEIYRIPISAGEVFMLPGGTPHSPQREAGSLGLVIERTRHPQDLDGLQWYCESCHQKLYEEFFNLTNIETQSRLYLKDFTPALTHAALAADIPTERFGVKP